MFLTTQKASSCALPTHPSFSLKGNHFRDFYNIAVELVLPVLELLRVETYSIYSFVFEGFCFFFFFFCFISYFISDVSMWFLAVIVLGRFLVFLVWFRLVIVNTLLNDFSMLFHLFCLAGTCGLFLVWGYDEWCLYLSFHGRMHWLVLSVLNCHEVGIDLTIVYIHWWILCVFQSTSPDTWSAGTFFLYFFYWRIIALQNFVVFCQTPTWISHGYTYIPSLLNLPPISLPIPPL